MQQEPLEIKKTFQILKSNNNLVDFKSIKNAFF